MFINSLKNKLWYKNPAVVFSILFLLKVIVFSETLGLTYNVQQESRILGTLGTLLLIFSFMILFSPKTRKFYIIAADLIITGLFFLDLFFFRHFQDVVTFRTLAAAWRYLGQETSWWKLLRFQDGLLIMDFVYAAWIFTHNCFRKIKYGHNNQLVPATRTNSFRKLDLVLIVMFLLGLGSSFQAYRLLEENQPDITKTFYSKVYIAQSLGALEFHALDIFRSWQITSSAPEQSVMELQNWFKSTHPNSVTTNSAFGIAKGKNLIVIQVESLQEFAIGKSINGQEVTPNLNKFLQQSLYFNNYFGETWNGGTSDAEFLSNTSLYPVSKGSAYIDYPMNHYVTTANTLSKEGYSNIAIEANKPGFWDMDLMSRSEGFQQVVDADDFDHDLDIGIGLADKSMFTQGIKHLENLKQPFYAFMITLSSHYPFVIPSKEKTIDVGAYKNTTFGNYLESLHYTDQAIGEFLNRLQSDGLLNNSVVAIYGDHPAPLDRHDSQLSKFLGFGAKGIDDFHWQAMQKVPLIIHLPGSSVKGVDSIVGGEVDLFPTLLGFLGQDAANYPLLGHDLLNSPAAGIAISRNGILVSENKLYNVTTSKAYDLNSGQPVPWDAKAAKAYQDYLNSTATIFARDLQTKLTP